MFRTVQGNLDEFDRLNFSYRAQIEHDGKTYILWKEHGLVRRLEIFQPSELAPFFTKRYIYWDGLFHDLPDELKETTRWTIWSVAA